MKTVKAVVTGQLLRNYDKIRWLIPNWYFAFRVAGGRIYLNVKESSMMMARALGVYEPEMKEALNNFLKAGATFLDIGGNKGDFSLLAAKIVGASGRVLCFEPEPTNCHWIERSIQLNGYKNVELFRLALSDSNGQAQLHLGTKSGFHSLIEGLPERNVGVIEVQTKTLDEVLRGSDVKTVDMMKIDVEGAELRVLKGARRTLEQNPHLILIATVHGQLGASVTAVCSFLRKLGFSNYRLQPPFDLPAPAYEDAPKAVHLLARQ